MLCTCIDCDCLSDFHEGRPVARVQNDKKEKAEKRPVSRGAVFPGDRWSIFFTTFQTPTFNGSQMDWDRVSISQ